MRRSWHGHLLHLAKLARATERRLAKGSHSLFNLILNVTSIIFAIYYLLKASHQVQPTFKGRELHKGTMTRKQIPLGAKSEAANSTHPTCLLCFSTWTLSAALRTPNWYPTQLCWPIPTYRVLSYFCFLANSTHKSGYVFQKLSVISCM